tara:strand:- start:13407 stop:14126 length:720 start_codon:yes stop_codon:yes gene_type:complete
MNKSYRPIEFLIWSGLVLVIMAITLAYVRERVLAPAKPRQVAAQNLGRDADRLPVINQVTTVGLTNQFGQEVTVEDLAGKVWLVDIIFTRCPGPCAVMTRRMREIVEVVQADLPIGFISITTDTNDTPAVLRQYADTMGADTNRWTFLTGEWPQIRHVATDQLKLVSRAKPEDTRDSENDLFIHSTTFALIDKQARLRGVVETIASPSSEDEVQTFVDPWETDYKPRILRRLQQLILEQ